jgi:ABC-type polar amino acid transport system ATPase subunit
MLEVKNLSVRKKRDILRNISLTVSLKKVTVLLGKSGSGKTTLLRCIAQLEREYKGEITYCGQKIVQENRNQTLGFVPQNYSLFPHLSALDNCAQPLRFKMDKEAAKEKAEKMLNSLGMDQYYDSYPHELSGGQQQRVALARSLLLGPSLLLLDEPTSSLDPQNTDLLVGIIRQLKEEGKGMIISTQDMAFAEKILDRAYFLEEGAIVDAYDSAELLSLSPESKFNKFISKFVDRGVSI